MHIESFEKGCEKLGLDPVNSLPDVSKVPVKYQKRHIAAAKLEIISEASREGVQIDWNKRSQYKWEPLFWMNNPGFRFYASYFSNAYSGSAGGSRFAYLSEEDSDYHAEQHLDLYRDMME